MIFTQSCQVQRMTHYNLFDLHQYSTHDIHTHIEDYYAYQVHINVVYVLYLLLMMMIGMILCSLSTEKVDSQDLHHQLSSTPQTSVNRCVCQYIILDCVESLDQDPTFRRSVM